VTERKPQGMSFVSWIDRQIQEATERGSFDNLPGAGKPLPDRGAFSTDVWIRDYLAREGVSAEEALPTPLRLRKESERLADSVHLLASQQQVREVVEDLNDRIRALRRLPEGPPVFVRLVDEQAMVARWRERRARAEPAGATGQAPAPAPRRSRWWHRLPWPPAFSRRE
jgi:hypothetical protein